MIVPWFVEANQEMKIMETLRRKVLMNIYNFECLNPRYTCDINMSTLILIGYPMSNEMYPPRPSYFQSCSSGLGPKSCCHDRLCSMRPWCSPPFELEPRHEKSQEQASRVLRSMESSAIKVNKKNPLEMLARLFPKQSMQALKRVLESCQGDPVFAIERILDRYPSEMDIDELPVPGGRERQRSYSVDEEMKPPERRLHGINDDHLSKLAMAYDIPLSLGKLHREDYKMKESKWEQKNSLSSDNSQRTEF